SAALLAPRGNQRRDGGEMVRICRVPEPEEDRDRDHDQKGVAGAERRDLVVETEHELSGPLARRRGDWSSRRRTYRLAAMLHLRIVAPPDRSERVLALLDGSP